MNGNAVRINVSLPSELVRDLKRLTPARGLSKFLSEAAEEKIARKKREIALKVLLEAPPAFEFLKGKDAAAKWVRKLRAGDEKRLRRIWSHK